jgi:hypothetical protein
VRICSMGLFSPPFGAFKAVWNDVIIERQPKLVRILVTIRLRWHVVVKSFDYSDVLNGVIDACRNADQAAIHLSYLESIQGLECR